MRVSWMGRLWLVLYSVVIWGSCSWTTQAQLINGVELGPINPILCAFMVSPGEQWQQENSILSYNLQSVKEYCHIGIISQCRPGQTSTINNMMSITGGFLSYYRCYDGHLSILSKYLLLQDILPSYEKIWLLDNRPSLRRIDIATFICFSLNILNQGLVIAVQPALDFHNSSGMQYPSTLFTESSSLKVNFAIGILTNSTYLDWFTENYLKMIERENIAIDRRMFAELLCGTSYVYVQSFKENVPSNGCITLTDFRIRMNSEASYSSSNHTAVAELRRLIPNLDTFLGSKYLAVNKISTELSISCTSATFPRKKDQSELLSSYPIRVRDNLMNWLSDEYVLNSTSNRVELPKLYAFHFPQFHCDTLNDKLWGRGFTDWDNLARIPRANRKGSTFPFPTELGYYDLLNVTTRRKQAELARMYGIDGFIYHHYFFYEKGLGATLALPLEALLKDNEPDLPFALHWANVPWTVTWQGAGFSNVSVGNMLQSQHYPSVRDPLVREHYYFLRKFFHHKNYIKVNNVPLFMTYNYYDRRFFRILAALRYLAMQDGFPYPGLHVPQTHGNRHHELSTMRGLHPIDVHKHHNRTVGELSAFAADIYYPWQSNYYGNRLPNRCLQLAKSNETRPAYLSVITAFDNTPRRGQENANIWDRSWINLPPSVGFERDLVETMLYDMCCQNPKARELGGKFVTINAWNEWAEGMVLEPSSKYGRSFLEAVLSAKKVVEAIQCDMKILDKYIESLSR